MERWWEGCTAAGEVRVRMRSHLLGAVPLVRAVRGGVAFNLPIPWLSFDKVKRSIVIVVSVGDLHSAPTPPADWAPTRVTVSVALRLDALGPLLAGRFFRA